MVTRDVIQELTRTTEAMVRYLKGQGGGDSWPSTDMNHSSAARASMDLTKVLAKWRKAQRPYPHGPK